MFKLFMCMNALSAYMSVYHVHSVSSNTKRLELQTLVSLRIKGGASEREADALKHRSIFPVLEYPSLLLLITTTTD